MSIRVMTLVLELSVALSITACSEKWNEDEIDPVWDNLAIDLHFIESPVELKVHCGSTENTEVRGCAFLNKQLKVCTVYSDLKRSTLRHEIELHCVEHKAHKLYQTDDATTL